MSKQNVIKGAMLLTITGILTRFIGFAYRIFLSNLIGAVQLGIYQMIFPIFSICATIYGAGIETAISHLTASEKTSSKKALAAGIFLSLSLSLFLAGLIFWNADFIAEHILMEPACAEPLKILVILFPFCGVSSCINGWYYGKQKTAIPAASQLVEQCVRVGIVYFFSFFFGEDNTAGCTLAVIGMCAGEIASCVFTVTSLLCSTHRKKNMTIPNDAFSKSLPSSSIFKKLLKLALPLTGNRLIVSLLSSAEAILIPACLKKYGLSSEEALAIYGVLTGMCLPFLFFPSTITNSLSVLLLPAVAKAQSSGNRKQIERTCSVTIQFCLLIGLLSGSVFFLLGDSLGIFFFHNELAGKYLSILAWLCPFLYLTATLGSILNGLNKAGTTLFNNVTGVLIRLLFVIYCIPEKGMEGYLLGMLIGQLATFLLDILAISKEIKINWNLWEWVAKPGITLLCIGFLISHFVAYVSAQNILPELCTIVISGLVLFFACVPYFYQCIKSA